MKRANQIQVFEERDGFSLIWLSVKKVELQSKEGICYRGLTGCVPASKIFIILKNITMIPTNTGNNPSYKFNHLTWR